jgi:hypothetical protein
MIPPNQQFLVLNTSIEFEDVGNINDAGDPKQIKWKAITDIPLY